MTHRAHGGVGDASAWCSVPILGFIGRGQPGYRESWGSLLEAHTLGKLSPRSRAARLSVGTRFPCESMEQGWSATLQSFMDFQM